MFNWRSIYIKFYFLEFFQDGKITISSEAYAKVKDSGYFFIEKTVWVKYLKIKVKFIFFKRPKGKEILKFIRPIAQKKNRKKT